MLQDLGALACENVLLGLGIASALLSTLTYLPYLRDTWSGRTRPQRASWLIWSVLGSVALAGQIHEEAGASLWFAVAQVSGTVAVFALSIRGGAGGYLGPADATVLGAAALGLIAWYVTDTAVWALAISISISLLGGSVTVAKAYRAPESETLATWLLSLVAAVCAVVSVGTVDWVLLAYPLYLFALNGAIVLAILLGRAARLRPPVITQAITNA